MYRRAVQSMYTFGLRRIISVHRNKADPCIRVVRCCYRIPQSMPEGWPNAEPEVESKLNFSNVDPDTFGTLSKEDQLNINEALEKMKEEPDDKEEYVIRDEEGKKQRRPIKFYHHLIKDLLKEKRIVDAVDVLNVRMKQDHIKPDYYTYNLLINGCAGVGYCKKSFQLYVQMKQKGIKQTPATYTGLFNACALAPDPEDSLIRLNNLRAKLREGGKELTLVNYNAMMKAYARLKDIHATFQVVDEMLSKGFTMVNDTFSGLLQACISDKENGMRHALLTWHKMRQKRVKPNLTFYNLFIRCIRDCDFGDEDEVKTTIERIVGDSATIFLNGETPSKVEDQKLLEGVVADCTNSELPTNIPTVTSPPPEQLELTFNEIDLIENRPNLLARKPHLGSIISLRSIKTPADRLLLLGGYKNLLKEMEADGVKPDWKTFNILLNVLPSSESAEKYIMEEMKKHNVPISIDFCNILIKQRALRRDYEAAKNVLSIIQSNYLQPDILTFGMMAMCCSNKNEVIDLIRSMRDFSMRLNAEILGAMVNQAVCRFNFPLVIFLMKLTQKYRISPNETYMRHLEKLEKRVVEIRRALRKNQPTQGSPEKNPNFREDSLIFSDYFAQWKKEVDVFKPPHPYKQFRQFKEGEPQKDGTTKQEFQDVNYKKYASK